ncbi:HotDog domain-containing protein [Diplogelasinospora grovesii]|uniref:HotDog domain-containing protein n=1 Tax=Diplogelasinospora grovesii TaxID=303347 RepID=A0AAN6MWV3_9PEZI|nr:HotDog domain-containing protein [Diplogelasinospora grovesii]
MDVWQHGNLSADQEKKRLALVAEFRSQPELRETRLHVGISPTRHLIFGALLGPGRLEVFPFAWSEPGRSYNMLCYLGSDVCGHLGVVHGGLLATMLDEVFLRCCSEALPHAVFMTANLTINYKSPVYVGRDVAIRVKIISVEGRKVRVEGCIETLDDRQPRATAEALFISVVN